MKPNDDFTREHIEMMWHVYVSLHKEEPRYADCQVRWLNEEESMPVCIKLNATLDEHDDEIFFYCNGLNDLLSLLEHVAEDFVLVDVMEFYNEID